MDMTSKTFETHKLHQLFVNNFGKIAISCFSIIVLVVIFYNSGNSFMFPIISTATIYSIVYITLAIFCKTFAQAITFNNDDRTITFLLTRGNGTLVVNYDDVSKVYINGYALFYFGNKRIMFRDLATDKEIYKYISEVGHIEFGILSLLDNQKAQFNKSQERTE